MVSSDVVSPFDDCLRLCPNHPHRQPMKKKIIELKIDSASDTMITITIIVTF